MSIVSHSQSGRPSDVTVTVPGNGDRLSVALQGAYRRERSVPDDMSALLLEIDNRTRERL